MTDHLIRQGASAGIAWKKSFEHHALEMEGLDNALLAQRAADLRDVGRRVLMNLSGELSPSPVLNEEAILIAEDLTPSDLVQLDRTRLLGICTVQGGSTSHTAILARGLGIPALVGMDSMILDMDDGTPVVLNGSSGELRLNPAEDLVTQAVRLQNRMAVQNGEAFLSASEPAVTTDGFRIEVLGNISAGDEAEALAESGGEGVGLLRSEFLFMDRSSAPTEDEQFEAYLSVLNQIPEGGSLLIRTLDVGGDKPLAYIPIPSEDNPFLGVRGIRVGLEYPDLLRTQIRAILRASGHGDVSIMFPMIASLADWREARAMLDQEIRSLGCKPIPAGMMVEVPSAAILAERFAEEVDFFSLGTNDLSQYTLAMDRGHARLSCNVDGLDPSVLHLVSRTATAGRDRDKPVGVCGGLAGEHQALPILLGLGVTKLSVSVPAIPRVKAIIRELSMKDCRALAEEALTLDSATEVRRMMLEFLPTELELGPDSKNNKGGDK